MRKVICKLYIEVFGLSKAVIRVQKADFRLRMADFGVRTQFSECESAS